MHVTFGWGGDADEHLEGGWSVPEKGFTWTLGNKATLVVPNPGPYACRLTLDYGVFAPPNPGFQRVALSIDGQPIATWIAFPFHGSGANLWIRREVLEKAGNPMRIDLELPDAQAPSEVHPGQRDTRRLGLSMRSLDIEPLVEPLIDANETTLARMAESMESLGRTCEFGLVQRHCGSEPLGLLRFSTSTVRSLLAGLEARFAGIGQDMTFDNYNNEWMSSDKRYGFIAHTYQNVQHVTEDYMRRSEARRLPWLANKLIADLEGAEKLFVYQGDTAQTAAEGQIILTALRRYNPRNTLLLVLANPERSGQVEWHSDGLMIGYLPSLTDAIHVADLKVEPWVKIVKAAHFLYTHQA